MAYVGVKMLISHYIKIPTALSLAIIGGVLFLGILASSLKRKSGKRSSQ
jgi:predicted tellurium resistance membrane protein TerC